MLPPSSSHGFAGGIAPSGSDVSHYRELAKQQVAEHAAQSCHQKGDKDTKFFKWMIVWPGNCPKQPALISTPNRAQDDHSHRRPESLNGPKSFHQA